LTEGTGVPVACIVSGANRTDMKKLDALLDALMIEMPAVAVPDETCDGRKVHPDRAYYFNQRAW